MKVDFHNIIENLQDLFTISFLISFLTFLAESDGGNIKLGEVSFELSLLLLVLLLICMVVKRVIKIVMKNKKWR